MLETALVLLLIGLIIAVILLGPKLVKQRRKRVMQRSLPPIWKALIENTLPMYADLSPDQRRQLQGHIQIFLAEKQFIGCAGLQVTEEMKVTIAAIACLLLLNGRGTYFSNLRSILLYPGTYWATETTSSDGYIVEEQRVARLGESWVRDQVVLSWEQVLRDRTHWQDGHNVVLHEFAHQLDQEDGQGEGVPVLAQRSNYEQWAKVMTQEYERLCQDVQRGLRTVMDRYGTTNPAEFFAVATETFFEKPLLLRQSSPALYQLLQDYYQLDPLQWF